MQRALWQAEKAKFNTELAAAQDLDRPGQPRQFAAPIAVRSWWLSVAVKAEPIEET